MIGAQISRTAFLHAICCTRDTQDREYLTGYFEHVYNMLNCVRKCYCGNESCLLISTPHMLNLEKGPIAIFSTALRLSFLGVLTRAAT